MSMGVPGASGVTTVMALDGYCSCARTGMASTNIAASAAAARASLAAVTPAAASLMASPSGEQHRAHRRGFGADQFQWQRHQGHALLGDAIEVVEVRQGHDAGLAQGAR